MKPTIEVHIEEMVVNDPAIDRDRLGVSVARELRRLLDSRSVEAKRRNAKTHNETAGESIAAAIAKELRK